MKARHKKSKTYLLKGGICSLVFSSLISFHRNNLPIEFCINKIIETLEYKIDFRVISQKIDANVFVKTIYEAYPIRVSTNRCRG